MRLNALENAEKRSTNRRTIIERLPSVNASSLVLVACSPNYFEKGGLTHLKITFQNNPTVIGERFEIHECIEIETYIRITSFNR